MCLGNSNTLERCQTSEAVFSNLGDVFPLIIPHKPERPASCRFPKINGKKGEGSRRCEARYKRRLWRWNYCRAIISRVNDLSGSGTAVVDSEQRRRVSAAFFKRVCATVDKIRREGGMNGCAMSGGDALRELFKCEPGMYAKAKI